MLLDKLFFTTPQFQSFKLSNGDNVVLRRMTGRMRDELMSAKIDDSTRMVESFYSQLLVRTLADESGKLLFDPKDAATLTEQIPWSETINEIVARAMEYNGIAKLGDDSAKKASTGASDGSGLSSPENSG